MVTISIFTCLTIYKFYLSQHFYPTFKLKRPKNFLISMYVINALFFIFYLPWCISYMMIVYVNYYTFNTQDSYYDLIYFYNISLPIAYLKNTSTFFVHIIFNKLFRNEFLYILRLKKKVSKSGAVTQVKTTGTKFPWSENFPCGFMAQKCKFNSLINLKNLSL